MVLARRGNCFGEGSEAGELSLPELEEVQHGRSGRDVSREGTGPGGFVSVLKEFRLDPTGNKRPSDDFKQKLTSLNKCF